MNQLITCIRYRRNEIKMACMRPLAEKRAKTKQPTCPTVWQVSGKGGGGGVYRRQSDTDRTHRPGDTASSYHPSSEDPRSEHPRSEHLSSEHPKSETRRSQNRTKTAPRLLALVTSSHSVSLTNSFIDTGLTTHNHYPVSSTVSMATNSQHAQQSTVVKF